MSKAVSSPGLNWPSPTEARPLGLQFVSGFNLLGTYGGPSAELTGPRKTGRAVTLGNIAC